MVGSFDCSLKQTERFVQYCDTRKSDFFFFDPGCHVPSGFANNKKVEPSHIFRPSHMLQTIKPCVTIFHIYTFFRSILFTNGGAIVSSYTYRDLPRRDATIKAFAWKKLACFTIMTRASKIILDEGFKNERIIASRCPRRNFTILKV